MKVKACGWQEEKSDQMDLQFGPVTVLVGDKNGKYPQGNSLLICGRDATAIVDPSMAVVARAGELRNRADLMLLSHVHEDHVAGVHLFPRAQAHAHRLDAPGLRSIDGIMAIYGYTGIDDAVRRFLIDDFHYVERPDTADYEDGAVFDLGGVRARAIHTPGHTRGHSVFLLEPGGVLFLGDIELSSFGPYYGDAWSDLEDFERSIAKVREIEARVWVSFHHVGVIENRAHFLDRLDRFAARIGEREQAILDFLREPRTLEEMIAHRFLYPEHATFQFIDAVERRTIQQHLARLRERGRVAETGGRWSATGPNA
jgi:glyoxylase-like metal-dependent hydrolase (beta-lactamase superfamily II)